MADVILAAQKYRQKIVSEIARVDEFLRFAEQMKELSESGMALPLRQAAAPAPTPAASAPAAAPEPTAVRAASEGPAVASGPEAGKEADKPEEAAGAETAARSGGYRSLFHGVTLGLGPDRKTA